MLAKALCASSLAMVICLRSEVGGRVRVWLGRGDSVENDGFQRWLMVTVWRRAIFLVGLPYRLAAVTTQSHPSGLQESVRRIWLRVWLCPGRMTGSLCRKGVFVESFIGFVIITGLLPQPECPLWFLVRIYDHNSLFGPTQNLPDLDNPVSYFPDPRTSGIPHAFLNT